MKRKRSLCIALAAVMVFGLAGCGGDKKGAKPGAAGAPGNYGADYLEKVKEKGTLIVGCDPTIQNINYMDESSGNVTGFIPDIVNGYAAELGVKVKWETLEWSAMITALNSGKVDMVAANMNMTIERESQLLLSDCWLLDHAKACVKTGSSFQTFKDISKAGVKFGITEGSAYEDIIRKTFPDAKIVTLSAGTWQDSLLSGIIDVAFDDGVVFAGPVAQNDKLRLLKDNGDAYMDGFAFSAGNYVMRDTFNLYLSKIKTLGSYGKMYKKWIGSEWVPEVKGMGY